MPEDDGHESGVGPPSNGPKGLGLRDALLGAARQLFSEHGFAATSLEAVAQGAGVPIEDLRSQFASKKELFRASLESVEIDFIGRLLERRPPGNNVWEHIQNGCQAFLDVALEPGLQRMFFVDGPVVLGWRAWREMEERNGFGLLQYFLRQAMDSGFVEPQPVETLTQLIAGVLNEAAMVIAQADDREAARATVGRSVARLLAGLSS